MRRRTTTSYDADKSYTTTGYDRKLKYSICKCRTVLTKVGLYILKPVVLSQKNLWDTTLCRNL